MGHGWLFLTSNKTHRPSPQISRPGGGGVRGSQETHGHDSMPVYSMSIGVTVICSGLFSYLLARSGDELPIGLSFLLKKNKLSINKNKSSLFSLAYVNMPWSKSITGFKSLKRGKPVGELVTPLNLIQDYLSPIWWNYFKHWELMSYSLQCLQSRKWVVSLYL